MQQSKFEEYNDISKYYDNKREAMGWRQVLEQLENPAEALVLDAGCGSGNYTMKLCKHVKEMVCFEVNGGMLGKLKAKCEAEKVNNVNFINGSLLEDLSGLAEYENKFDLITINQVIHHLDTDHDTYPNF
jgi:ubiquinone/menaquinone biosynthesis C-methylase UbiE